MKVNLQNYFWPNIVSWILILFSYVLISKDSSIFEIVFLVDIWLLSHPHALITFFKKRTYQTFSIKSLITIFVITMIVLSLVAREKGQVGLYFIYFFWQWFHYFRQNYGISFKLLKSSNDLIRRFEYLFNHIMPLLAILILFSKGPLDFLGHYIPFFNLQSFQQIFEWGFLVLIFLWGFLNSMYLVKNKNHLPYFVNTASTFVLYYFAYVFAQHFIYGWLGLTIYHNVQYLFFTYQDRSFELPFFNKSKAIGFYSVLTLFSVVVYGLIFFGTDLISSRFIPLALITVFSLNILHYVVDSWIWKKA